MDRSMEYLKTKDVKLEEDTREPETTQPFTAKTVMHTLQFLVRESPTLAPWVAKFKCKRILLNCLKGEGLRNREALQKQVFSLINKYDEQNECIPEVGFLQVLLRLFSPFLLNSVTGLVFELCLDSTPLVLNSVLNSKSSEPEEPRQKWVSFGSVVRQKVVSELDSILFGGSPLEHLFRKAALLNTLSVLANLREMAKLLLECNFVSKLYSEYVLVVSKYAEGKKVFLMPGLYLTRLYIPFFLQPLSILQELNIAFHHNKKLTRAQTRSPLNALLLNEDAINAQLIPVDVLKKSKFKQEWSLGRDPPKKNHNNRPEERFSDSDSDSDL